MTTDEIIREAQLQALADQMVQIFQRAGIERKTAIECAMVCVKMMEQTSSQILSAYNRGGLQAMYDTLQAKLYTTMRTMDLLKKLD